MIRSISGSGRALLIALAALTATACASSGDIDSLRAQVEQAQRDAKSAQQAAADAQRAADQAKASVDEAKRAAGEASVAADAAMAGANTANNCCAANTERIERAFRKTQQK